MKTVVIILIRMYRASLGLYIGGNCRFYPSCSDYAIEAVREHGALRGLILSLKRLGRCRPYGPQGVDLVPR